MTAAGIYAWTKNYYGPVSGNWCWIEKQYLRQRYTLNHGWRFAIFVISLCTYIYVFVYMSRRLRPQGLSNLSSSIPDDLDYEKIHSKPRDDAVLAGCGVTPRLSLDKAALRPTTTQNSEEQHRAASSSDFPGQLQISPTRTASHDESTMTMPHVAAVGITSQEEINIRIDLEKGIDNTSLRSIPVKSLGTTLRTRRAASRSDHKTKVDREIWRMLLLNMYPVTYLILWIPGIANRIAEGMGYEVRALVILQSSTQFIGLANASVYVYKEHKRDIREWWAGVKGRKAAKAAKAEKVGSDDESSRVRYWRSHSPQ